MENMQKEAMMMVCIRHLQSLGEGLLKRKVITFAVDPRVFAKCAK